MVFAVRTDDREDLEYLEELLQKHPGEYRMIATPTLYRDHVQSIDWRHSYSSLPGDCLCIKIDDDILYIQVRTAIICVTDCKPAVINSVWTAPFNLL